jgi:hypothetical protein
MAGEAGGQTEVGFAGERLLETPTGTKRGRKNLA